MPERRIDRARRRARQALVELGADLREARLAANLTQRDVGRLVGMSHTQMSRIERGLVPRVSYSTIACYAAVVGLAVPLRAYPGDDPVRDAAQIALLARFRMLVASTIRHRTEVPIGPLGDRRAWG